MLSGAAAIRYVPLACHSWHSLLKGTDSIESLCVAAARIGVKALALTDVNALYGALRFWETAREAGLTPLLGADIVAPAQRGRESRKPLLCSDRRGRRVLPAR